MAETVYKGAITIDCAGEQLCLLPQRALFWARFSTLFISDTHFGKDATFRSAGIGLPEGGTTSDLLILSEVVEATRAEHLVILGDFFHTKTSRSEVVLAALSQWRSRCQALAVTLVQGNHDRHAGLPPDELNIRCVGDEMALGPFVCYHEPVEEEQRVKPSRGYGLCGHLHPVYTLRDRDGTSFRFPVFHFAAHQGILPAFARFTGGYQVQKRKNDRIFLVGDEKVWEVSS